MLMITIGSKSSALADVNVGDAIDSSNWQKVQGLLPEPVLEYLKKGWITMKIGKLNYEPAETWYLLEGEKRNKGKYDIAPDGQMMEKATGVKSPLDFIACPFPGSEMDPKDPKFSQKFFYNVYMNIACQGSHSQTALFGFLRIETVRTLHLRSPEGPEIPWNGREYKESEICGAVWRKGHERNISS